MVHGRSPPGLHGGDESIILLRTMQHGFARLVTSMMRCRPLSQALDAFRVVVGVVTLSALIVGGSEALAQSSPPPSTQSASSDDDSVQASRRRRRASKPAEVQAAHVLQVEYGYGGDFLSRDVAAAQAFTLSLNYSATPRLLLELAHDNVATVRPRGSDTAVGLGNTYLGAQYTVTNEDERHPSVALAYQATAPTGRSSAGISTGGYWHRATLLVSKDVRTTTLDVNVSVLANDLGAGAPTAAGVQFVLSAARTVRGKTGLQVEVEAQSRDADEPRGMYTSASVTYQVSAAWQWDAGLRVGLTPTAPRIGAFAGVTRAVAFSGGTPRQQPRRPAL